MTTALMSWIVRNEVATSSKSQAGAVSSGCRRAGK
jgi:hypothetical protein